MEEVLGYLIQLQQVDLEIRKIEEVRDSFPARVHDLEDQIQAKKKVEGVEEEDFKEVNQLKEEKESKHKEDEGKIKKWEQRRDKSQDHREISALNREIDAHWRMNEELGTEVLELIDKVEQKKKVLDGLKAEIRKLEKSLKKEKEICDEKLSEFDKELETYIKDRKQYVEKLSRSVLRRYESLKKNRAGIAVVAAKDGSCTGCNMRLRPQLYITIQKMQSLESCPGCKRMLFWEKGMANGIS